MLTRLSLPRRHGTTMVARLQLQSHRQLRHGRWKLLYIVHDMHVAYRQYPDLNAVTAISYTYIYIYIYIYISYIHTYI